jgi:hypothetical protein
MLIPYYEIKCSDMASMGKKDLKWIAKGEAILSKQKEQVTVLRILLNALDR